MSSADVTAAVPTAVQIRAEIDSNSTQLAAIVADTNELQTNQGNWLTATGFSTHTAANVRTEMDSNSTQLAAILTDTGTTIPAQISGLNNISSADVTTACTSSLNTYDAPTNTEMLAAHSTTDALITTVDTVVDAIKVTTDKLDDTLEDDAGTYRFTENALEQAPTGGSAPTVSEIADAVWDEVITAAAHNDPTSAGRRLRQLTDLVVHDGTATGGGSTYIDLDAAASSTDGTYDPSVLSIIDGTGSGQTRQIFEYNGTLKRAYVNRDWKVNPDATSQFIIISGAGDTHVNEGKAQGGTSTTMTLNTLASSVDDVYNDQIMYIVAGTGADQARHITDYNGTTKVATTNIAWNITPDDTSIYAVLPFILHEPVSAAAISDQVWTEPIADHSGTSGSTAEQLAAAGSAGDPWATAIPGSYTSGQAGYKLNAINTKLDTTAASIAAALDGTTLNIRRGDTFTVEISSLGTLTSYTNIWFTIKRSYEQADSDSEIQIDTTTGLLYINGASGTAAKGSITVDDASAGDITITLDETETAKLGLRDDCYYDVKMLNSGTATTLTQGRANIIYGVTKATS